jgi:hypothetical protein
MPVHEPNGATVTDTSPRRSQRETDAGDRRTSTRPCPTLDRGSAATGYGEAQRSRECLELGLDDVVRVAAGQHPDVEGDLRVEGEGLQDVARQRPDVVAADDDVLLPLGLPLVDGVGASGDVDDGLDERLVERDGGVAEPGDAALVAECLAHGLPEDDRDVLDGVVGVDMGVAVGLHGEVDERVLRERQEHVVVERDAGADVTAAGAVEVDGHLHGALGRAAAHGGGAVGVGAHGAAPVRVGTRAATASRNLVVSSGVPAVTRR